MNENTSEIQSNKSSKNNKKTFYFIAAVFVLVAIVAGLWFWFNYRASKTPESASTSSLENQLQQPPEENDPYAQVDTLGAINSDLENIAEIEDVNLEEIDRDLNSL